ncbi:Creatinase/aminopeptidase [Hesseltinella vesiculosa]|uniref:Creatinase/aminopeptidase n=1 Tax=Hesseltinella vesiculosa TaxID=101127 RepID=A0A1X2G2N3_9FUNG|nr:Creatinase/aminopeptidase [Hesseltinella vesiculosa]
MLLHPHRAVSRRHGIARLIGSIRYLSQHERLPLLRKAMATATEPIDVLIVPTEDAHQSEYTAECDNRRAWLSGFTGSAGCAVVSADQASLFTDGRYFLQAEQELDAQQWQLMKQGLPGVPNWQDYCKLFKNKRIGIDASVITADQAAQLQRELQNQGSTLIPMNENLVDKIRGTKRPPRPSEPVHVHPLKYAGKSHRMKIDELRQDIKAHGMDATIVTSLDEIAWLLNLRGSDIHCCPVFFSYCVVTQDQVLLYAQENANQSRWQPLMTHLQEAAVQIKPYDAFLTDLAQLANDQPSQAWLLDPHTANVSIADALGSNVRFGATMIPRAKAIKNAQEVASTKACHVRDGAAVTRHFAWLAHSLKHDKVTEHDAATHLASIRQQDPAYVGLSFDTIAATGANGAIIHYQPPTKNSPVIDPAQVYLCDSGAQYLDGTTDVTRTYLFAGNPSGFQKLAFTRVLQCHIALDQAVFPENTTGYQLDTLARAPLWKEGLNYRHGTGHGVGAYLNVHEGPIGISSRIANNAVALEENMLVTNEPGYYQDGEFGIRLENVLCVKKVATPYHFDSAYLGFDHLTFVPFGQRLLEPALLSRQDIQWLNAYHQECRDHLGPLLKNDPQALQWLELETIPLQYTLSKNECRNTKITKS